MTLYVPEGYGLGTLRRLVYSGCKAIGEREHLKLMLECNKRVFPHDFPETNAGAELAATLALEGIKADYCPRPPSKRVNFQIYRQPAPFNPLVLFPRTEGALRPVTVQAVCRGVPVDKSLIYLPTEDDLRIICLEYFTKR